MIQVSTGRPPLGPGIVAKYDYELRAVDGIGLSEVEMDAVLTLVLGYVGGAARGAAEQTQAEEHTGVSLDEWWYSVSPLLERAFDESRYPVASRVGSVAGGSSYDTDATFEFGLQRVLDGIQAFVQADADERRKRMPPGLRLPQGG